MTLRVFQRIGYSFIIMLLLIQCNQTTRTEDSDNFVLRKTSFNRDWQFYLADSSGVDSLPEKVNWRTLHLPHDWSIEGEFNENNPAGHGGGYLPGGLGWYKKTFTVDAKDSTKLIFIQFDGIYQNSDVWINGHHLGYRPNGYIGFEYELSDYLNYDNRKNEILVKVDNSKQPNSRWYSGSGIYRNVWLKQVNKIHISQWGSFITTPSITKDSAKVVAELTIMNRHEDSEAITVKTSVFDGEHLLATTSQSVAVDSQEIIRQNLTVTEPSRWSVDNPKLYSAVTKLERNGEIIDEYTTPFGTRSFEFSNKNGFLLNGEQVKIKGVCLHHDLGPLGAAINTRAIERRLEILKEMGVNGIRTAHNMPSPELLNLCDEMGFIVMDESYDMWNKSKTEFDYANEWDQWHEKDLVDFIKRDRNHPSIFIWSVGNEIPEQWEDLGVETTNMLKQIVHRLDSTRPLTVAMNPPVNMPDTDVTTQFDASKVYKNPVAASGELDLIGYNYAHQSYEYHDRNFPNTPFIATETTSTLQTRGTYDFPSDTMKLWPVRWDVPFDGGNENQLISAFDQVRAPWGSLHETAWKIIKKHDFLSGMYIWTGFDYIGEPTPYTWPSRSSYFGIVDLAGFPKDVYYMYQSEWTDKDVLHLFPHWNWGKGQTVDVWAYYNHADEVELFVNGESAGIRQKKGDDLHVMWRVPFEPGSIRAVSRKDGKTVQEKIIQTAGEAAKLSLEADRTTIHADGKDLSFITISILDENGILVPTAMNQLNFDVKGNGHIVGVASGDQTNHESFKGNTHKALHGKCLVIVQSTKTAGTVTVSVSSQGLDKNQINITTEKNGK